MSDGPGPIPRILRTFCEMSKRNVCIEHATHDNLIVSGGVKCPGHAQQLYSVCTTNIRPQTTTPFLCYYFFWAGHRKLSLFLGTLILSHTLVLLLLIELFVIFRFLFSIHLPLHVFTLYVLIIRLLVCFSLRAGKLAMQQANLFVLKSTFTNVWWWSIVIQVYFQYWKESRLYNPFKQQNA